MAAMKKWPGESDACHPELFTIPPSPPNQRKPGQLTDQQVREYFEEGFVIVENYFDIDKDLEPVKADIEVLVEDLAQKLYKGGKISNLYNDADLSERLSLIEKEFPGANILMHKTGKLPDSFRALWSNEKLLNLAEQLVGTSDISGHPVWNIRTKTPRNEASTVPWHQDSAYLDTSSYDVMQVTAWIPLLDATETNGCLQMMKRGHRTGRVAKHQCCHGDTWYIMLPEEEMKNTLGIDPERDVVTCPVPYGGAVFFSNAIPHRSLNNLSNQIRWSLDLRWQRSDKPVGFYGLKQGVQMRSSRDPNFKINWEPVVAVNRHTVEMKYTGKEDETEFDTTIPGPWMKQWEMVHSNRHTQAAEAASGGTPWHSSPQ